MRNQDFAIEVIFHDINKFFLHFQTFISLVLLRVMNAQDLGNDVTNMTSLTNHDEICLKIHDNYPYEFSRLFSKFNEDTISVDTRVLQLFNFAFQSDYASYYLVLHGTSRNFEDDRTATKETAGDSIRPRCTPGILAAIFTTSPLCFRIINPNQSPLEISSRLQLPTQRGLQEQ